MNKYLNSSTNTNSVPTGERELGAPARLLIDFIDTVKLFWDRIGLWIAVSISFSLLVTAIYSATIQLPLGNLLVRQIAALLAAAIVLPAPAAGAYGLVQKVYAHEEVEYMDLWRGARRMLLPAITLGFCYLIVFGIGALNILFYFRFRNVVGGIAMLVSIYLSLFVMLMSNYHFALLASAYAGHFDGQSSKAPRSLFSILKRAFYLVIGDPIYSCGVLALTLIPTVLMLTVVVPFILLWLGYIAVLHTVCTRAQLIKYGILSRPEVIEPVSDADFRIKG